MPSRDYLVTWRSTRRKITASGPHSRDLSAICFVLVHSQTKVVMPQLTQAFFHFTDGRVSGSGESKDLELEDGESVPSSSAYALSVSVEIQREQSALQCSSNQEKWKSPGASSLVCYRIADSRCRFCKWFLFFRARGWHIRPVKLGCECWVVWTEWQCPKGSLGSMRDMLDVKPCDLSFYYPRFLL